MRRGFASALALGAIAGAWLASRRGGGAWLWAPACFALVFAAWHAAALGWRARLGDLAAGARVWGTTSLALLLPLPLLIDAAIGGERLSSMHGLAALVLLGLAMRAVGPLRLAARAGSGHAEAAARIAAPILCVAALVAAAHRPDGDEPHYQRIADALRLDGTVDLTARYTAEPAGLPRPGDPRFHGVIRRTSEREARYVSQHLPGLPALLVPGIALGGRLGACLTMACLGILACGLATALARRAGVAGGAAMAAGLVVALGAPLGPFAVHVFPEVAAAALLAAAAYAAGPGARVTTGRFLLAAACLSALPWLNPRFAGPGLALGLVCVWRARRTPVPLAACVAVPAAVAVAWFAAIAAWYGSADPRAIFAIPGGLLDYTSPRIAAGIGLGLLADRRVGLLVIAPAWLALLAAGPGWRRPAWCAPGLGVAAVTMLNTMSWDGSHAPPGRFLACAMPVAAPLLAAGLAGLWNAGRGGRGLAVVLLGLTALHAFAGLANPSLAWPDGADHPSFVWRLLDPGPLLPDLDPRSPPTGTDGPWLLGVCVLAGAAALTCRLARRAPSDTY